MNLEKAKQDFIVKMKEAVKQLEEEFPEYVKELNGQPQGLFISHSNQLEEYIKMRNNFTIERKLRSAVDEDIKNNANKLFYFKEGLHITRITRMLPEDYNNWKWIKDTKDKEAFKESCREDWADVTDKLFTLLMEENLYIEKNEDIR